MVDRGVRVTLAALLGPVLTEFLSGPAPPLFVQAPGYHC